MDCHVADAPRNDGYLTRHCGLAVIAAWLSLRLGRHCERSAAIQDFRTSWIATSLTLLAMTAIPRNDGYSSQ
jgi:hypothetical protein